MALILPPLPPAFVGQFELADSSHPQGREGREIQRAASEAIRALSEQIENALPCDDEVDADYSHAPFKIVRTIKIRYGRPVASKPRRVSFDD
jgi:hypothetical protein